MAEDDRTKVPDAPVQGENPCGGVSGFLMIFFGIMLIMLMFDPQGTGEPLSRGLGGLLMPVVGFAGRRPLWTLFFAGMITVVFSTVARHYFANWVETARTQQSVGAFNKELREAQKDNNQGKFERLQKMQPQIMAMQSKLMWGQLKPMVFTMFIAILIWRWLYVFMDEEAVQTAVSMPWGAYWPLNARADWCMIPSPAWLLIYMLLSVSVGQILMRGLKVLEFKSEVKAMAKQRRNTMGERVEGVKSAISAAGDLGVSTATLQRDLKGVQRAVDEEDFVKSARLLDTLEDRVEDLSTSQVRAMKEIEVATAVTETTRTRGANVSGASAALRKANAMARKGDPTATIAFAREAKTLARQSRETYEEISGELGEVGVLVIDKDGAAFDGVRGKVTKAKNALARGGYADARELGAEARTLYDHMLMDQKVAAKSLAGAARLRKQASAENILAGAEEDILRSAEELFQRGDYTRASKDLEKFTETVGQRMDEYQDYSKELMGAELVLSKAGSLVDVSSQQARLEKARDLAGVGKYGQAKNIALEVQKEADAMHKKAVRKDRR